MLYYNNKKVIYSKIFANVAFITIYKLSLKLFSALKSISNALA